MSEKRYIYVLDTFGKCELDEYGYIEIKGQRCVGCFSSLENAEKVILSNIGDIYECGTYPFAQIERVGLDGVYQQDIDSRQWYEWVGGIYTGHYERRPIPECLKHLDICGIG